MNIAESAEAFAELVRRVDEGDASCLTRMDAYPSWLQKHFGKSTAAAIIEEDFGAPIRLGSDADAERGVKACAEAV